MDWVHKSQFALWANVMSSSGSSVRYSDIPQGHAQAGLGAPLLKWAGPPEEVAETVEGEDTGACEVGASSHLLPEGPTPTFWSPHPQASCHIQIRTILEAAFASLTFQNSIKEAKDS